MHKKYYRCLSIAGSDSGGCAGIQADLKTFSAFRCFGMSAVTALTAQNTLGVRSIYPVSPDFVSEQIEAVISDIGVDAIKIGMLHRPEIIDAVVSSIKKLSCSIVLDPVMFSKNGCALLSKEAINILRDAVLPLATIVTPNIPEAEYLANMIIKNSNDAKNAALKIAEYGVKNILIKGGHTDSDQCIDILYHHTVFTEFNTHKIATNNTHGTGCTLSAAIAAELSKGKTIVQAVDSAKKFITRAIESGSHYSIGNGYGPVDFQI